MIRNEPYTDIKEYVVYPGGVKVPVKSNNYPFGANGWRFTEDEIKSINKAFYSPIRGKLRVTASERNIDLFIAHLEQFCSAKKYWVLDRPKRAEVRKAREKILVDCNAALGHLKLIHQCKVDLCNYNDLEVFAGDKDDPISTFRMQSWGEADAARKTLEKFIATLENYHLAEEVKTGRDRADSDNLIKAIREIYTAYIGKEPKGHRTSSFTDIVKAVYSILGLPAEDPSRAIDAALKKE
jgi:hypothetical protein